MKINQMIHLDFLKLHLESINLIKLSVVYNSVCFDIEKSSLKILY